MVSIAIRVVFEQEEEAAAKAQQEKKAKMEVVEDGVLELSEDGSFDTSAATVAAASAAKASAVAAATATAPDAESEPMQVGDAKGIDFAETEEEKERKLREEEEDKTPPRTSLCELFALSLSVIPTVLLESCLICMSCSAALTNSLCIRIFCISSVAQRWATAAGRTSTCGRSSCPT
jgi:hypothetical protein